jgi:uncharacterized membrane protein
VIAHGIEWLELMVRWLHVVTGIAWIGTSFYFNWLNDNIRPPRTREDGVKGELWSVHGGGFYRVLKYAVAPGELPGTLHWFKWEAYFTWISGFSLLVLVYYVGADVYLVDAAASPIGPAAAVGVGLATLVVGWLAYDGLCRSPLAKAPVPFTAVGLVAFAGAAYGLSQLFTGRGAYIHVGALIGTIMAANVFFVIIPNQKRMVGAMERGQAPDADEGKRAALRSRHNNYLTLPVLFIMVSNHYPLTYGHEWSWALLAGISIAGALVRHWFNVRNMGQHNRFVLPAAAAAMVGLGFVTAPEPPPSATAIAAGEDIDFQIVASVLTRRCAQCHSATPTHELFTAPPAGITLSTREDILSRASQIRNVVAVKAMPPGNVTGMTPTERELIRRWSGAP